MAGTEQGTEGLSENEGSRRRGGTLPGIFSEGVAGMRTGLSPFGKPLTVI